MLTGGRVFFDSCYDMYMFYGMLVPDCVLHSCFLLQAYLIDSVNKSS